MKDDLISRQAAITLPVMPKEYREYQTFNLDDAYEQGWDDLQKCIEELPSAQPEVLACGSGELNVQPIQQWIPCSERLPEENGRYLVTNSAWGAMEVDWNAWVDGAWLYPNTMPIAWMPLPEPYTIAPTIIEADKEAET